VNKHTRKVLIIDNHLTEPCHACSVFRGQMAEKYRVIIRTHDQMPKTLDRYSHILLTGGAGRLDPFDEPFVHLRRLIRKAVKEQVPVLGICFGHEAIVAALRSDASITNYEKPTTGWVKIRRTGESRLLKGLPEKFYAFEHHRNYVNSLPAGFITTATSNRDKIEAFEHEALPIFGVQFHPDITHRRASHLIKQHLIERLPKSWLMRPPHKGHTPFSATLYHQIFKNFYEQKRAD
jgi:GMP synthase-like glutamine amidotransferase